MPPTETAPAPVTSNEPDLWMSEPCAEHFGGRYDIDCLHCQAMPTYHRRGRALVSVTPSTRGVHSPENRRWADRRGREKFGDAVWEAAVEAGKAARMTTETAQERSAPMVESQLTEPLTGYGFRTLGDSYQVFERGTLRHITDAPDEATACAIASTLTRETANLRAKLCLFAMVPTREPVAREVLNRCQMIDGETFPRCAHRVDLAQMHLCLGNAREALVFYADPRTYDTVPEGASTLPIMSDEGRMAERTLRASFFVPLAGATCTGDQEAPDAS